MRIAVDARELEGQPTGVGRVLEGLLEAWPEGDKLTLIARSQPRLTRLAPHCRVQIVDAGSSLPGSVWEQVILPRTARGADVLLCPNYSMPRFAPCPTVVCMHDCAPFALPETFGWRERTRRRLGARIAARQAAFLFMGSRFAADQAAQHLGVEAARLLVIPWGLTAGFTPPPADRVEEARTAYGLGEQCVLFVGTAMERRGLAALSQIVAVLATTRPRVELCVIGAGAADPGLRQESVRQLGYVPEDDLPALYAAARVVAYPSRYEGFGLPVLEALACGTPVVASDAPALHEVYAGRAHLVPHTDRDKWETALGELLDSDAAHRSWVERGQRWALAQDWATSAATLRARIARAGGVTA